MAEVHGIPVRDIQHAALEHDVRAFPTRRESDKAHEKAHELDAYRTELMTKVHEHIAELHAMEDAAERTAVFKEEMLGKVHEHMEELEKEEAKKDEVAKIKGELMEKVRQVSPLESSCFHTPFSFIPTI